jgi:hypothetical protein
MDTLLRAAVAPPGERRREHEELLLADGRAVERKDRNRQRES